MATALAESPVLRLHRDDNIAIAKRTIRPGTEIDVEGTPTPITVSERVEIGHKVAVLPIAHVAAVRKYGQTIGFATADIAPGQWVHTHNVEAGTLSLDYAIASEVPPPPRRIAGRTFLGYRRADGRAATRNYIGIVSTVNCSAATSRFVAQQFDQRILEEYPNIDGVVPLVHKAGCAMQYGGDDHQQLSRVLSRLRQAPEHRRVPGDRTGLRDGAGFVPGRELRPHPVADPRAVGRDAISGSTRDW